MSARPKKITGASGTGAGTGKERRLRIAIANDMRLAIEALRRVVSRVPSYEVAWVAWDGAEALARCKEDRPDVLLLDLVMPVMDGVECIRRIMAEAPCAILVVTGSVSGNYSMVYDAMGAGALDAVNTPVLGTGGDVDGGSALLDMLARVGHLVAGTAREVSVKPARSMEAGFTPPLCAIGASTGGPQALATILATFPADLLGAVVLIQHVDIAYAAGLATWLEERSRFPVRVAKPGDKLERGVALLAGTNDHLILRKDLTVAYTAEPRAMVYRPSVNVFLASVATHWPYPGVAALLTGMGSDGADGLLALRRLGWFTVAQDERSSVVYGMPRAAALLGAATQVLPLDQIGSAIVERLNKSSSHGSQGG